MMNIISIIRSPMIIVLNALYVSENKILYLAKDVKYILLYNQQLIYLLSICYIQKCHEC